MARCVCPSSYKPAAYVWAFMSILAAIMCPFGLYYSNWLERKQGINGTWNSMSSFRLCLDEPSRISTGCTSYVTFGKIYSVEWKAVTLLMGLGACLLLLVALTSIFGFFVRKLFNKVVVVMTFCFQALGTLLFIVAIVLFPAGTNVPEVMELCSKSGATIYNIGECSLGWAFYLIIIGTFIALVATFLSWTTVRWRDKEDSEPYTI